MKTQQLKWLIFIMIIINAFGMLFPGLSSTFTPWYGSIAKHIIVNNDWVNLTFAGQDWLDKPHLPFWLTAFSFKVFGINTFAYILPGFLFNLIGMYYTYLLAQELYDTDTALISTLIYVSAFHIMTSNIDVRAEAFLLGQIIPACYYWLLYDKNGTIKNLVLGAFFTGLALMTKGLFVIITIMSGVSCVWIYRRQFINFIRPKWLIALALCFIFAIPELLALYLQFDLHPEKIVFGKTNVSGIKFFFWDSQFGRFFSTGPIASTNPPPLHQLFFVHTFLWAFLPWTPVFLVALWATLTKFKNTIIIEREKYIFLLGSFFISFILFSLSTLQVDHYTNIIIPFAAILCAQWLVKQRATHAIYTIQKYLSYLLIGLVAIISSLILHQLIMIYCLSVVIISIIIMFYFRKKSNWTKILLYPTIAIAVVFIFFELVNGLEYVKYDAGYKIAQYLNTKPAHLIIDYNANLLSLEFHSKQNYERETNLNSIMQFNKPFYLVTKQNNLPLILKQFPNAIQLQHIDGMTIKTFLANSIHPEILQKELNNYVILEVHR